MPETIRILGVSSTYSAAHSTTDYALDLALQAAREVDPRIQTDVLQLRKYHMEPCINCNYCKRTGKGCCQKDDTAEVMERFFAADAYIFASPVYSYNPTPSMLLLFNKMRSVGKERVLGLFGRPGAALAVGGSRSGGQEATITCMMNLMLARNIIVVGGSSANFNYTGGKMWTRNCGMEGAMSDEVGITSMRDIGTTLARASVMLLDGKGKEH